MIFRVVNSGKRSRENSDSWTLSCQSRFVYAVSILLALFIYEQRVLSVSTQAMQHRWRAIVSEDFGTILRQYEMGAVLVWNNCGEENVYSGAQIGTYWQRFFKQHAIEAYDISAIQRDRRTIKARITAVARPSKGSAKKVHIFHRIEVNPRGKIVQETWIVNRRK